VGVRLRFHHCFIIVVQFVEGADRLELDVVVDVIDCVHGGGDDNEDGENLNLASKWFICLMISGRHSSVSGVHDKFDHGPPA